MDCPDFLCARLASTERFAAFEPLATTIIARLQAQPERCALRFRDASITNSALLNKILRLAERLPEAGIGAGVRVGVSLERGPETLVVLLALWLLGAVYVPLNPVLPRARLLSMCNSAGLDFLITEPSLQSTMSSLPCVLLILEAMAFDIPSDSPPLSPPTVGIIAVSDPAYILFTSGSSGSPKGVMISQGNIAALFSAVLPLLALPDSCRILGCANFSFDIAFFELLAPLLCGGTLVLADARTCTNPEQLTQLIESEQVSVVQATPSHWQLLTAFPLSMPLLLAIATGEALPRATAAVIMQRTNELWNMYGPTECTIWASAHRVGVDDLHANAPRLISIGTALPGYTLDLEYMPESAEEDLHSNHELVIGGSGVGLGYCADTESGTAFRPLAEHPAPRSYHTGDLCRWDADGLLHFLGRRDNQVKHNGYRIELDEIALLLQQQASISQAACLINPATESNSSLLFACVVFKPGLPNKNKIQLNAYLATYLPVWMLPQRYYFLDSLPLTTHGKLDRKALLALTDSSAGRINPQNSNLEARVAQVFCDVLDIDSIGLCDSFLDTGGSSMLAATLVLTLNERLGSTLTLRQALTTPPTVSSIVKLLMR